MKLNILFILYMALALVSCRSNKSTKNLTQKTTDSLVQYVDSLAATKAIVEEDVDGFFDQISIVDMTIQMKSEEDYSSREDALVDYKALLRAEVMDWTDHEKILMNDIFDTIKTKIDRINPMLMPKDIRLVKIRTNHYGPDVYYTRGHNIMIPENVLSGYDAAAKLEPVMIHEIFHLLSRYHPDLKEKIYALIGFFPHNKELEVPVEIRERWLTNPDGVATDYFIQLRDDKIASKAIPLIMTNKPKYSSNNPSFFGYLQFDLYEMVDGAGNKAKLQHADLATTLTDGMMPGFFEQIKDNTQYIIHPDEISADNFIYAVTESDVEINKNFSKEGAELIVSIQNILSNWQK